MSTRSRNLALTAGVSIVLLMLLWNVFSSAPDSPGAALERSSSAESPAPTPTSSYHISEVDSLRSYAVSLADMRGLPSDARPGTRLDLWVTWDADHRPRPRFHRLLQDVVLDRIIPPLAAGSPGTALLSVPEREITALLYGDRFGSLSATVRLTR